MDYSDLNRWGDAMASYVAVLIISKTAANSKPSAGAEPVGATARRECRPSLQTRSIGLDRSVVILLFCAPIQTLSADQLLYFARRHGIE